MESLTQPLEPFLFEVDFAMLVALIALGLVIGLISGLFGVGGGFLLTPLLNVVLGVPYNLAVGSTLVQMSVMTWVGTRKHAKLGHVDKKLGFSLMAGAFLGAELGVRIQRGLRGMPAVAVGDNVISGFDLSMSFLFIVLLLTISILMLRETGRSGRRGAGRTGGGAGQDAAASDEPLDAHLGEEPSPNRFSLWLVGLRARPVVTLSTDPSRRLSFWVPAGVGFSVSILTGLLGTGGGFLHMPVLIYVLGIPTTVAIGTASLQTAVAAVYSGVRYIMLGDVVWPLVGSILLGSVGGAQIGAALSERLPQKNLRRIFAYIVLGTVIMVLWDLAREIAG